jgi:transcriptional regulator GlxA family with amidase domain
MPKQLSILVFEDTSLVTLAQAYSLLLRANKLEANKNGTAPFCIELLSTGSKEVDLHLPVQWSCSASISEVPNSDLIIIPPLSRLGGSPEQVLKKYQVMYSWLRKQRTQGADIISLCTGCYFLAEAGLLDGKQATSHWMVIEDLHRRYPKVLLTPDLVVTDNEGICTGGGSYSSLSTLLYCVEKYFSRETAFQMSKEYAIDFSRTSQGLFRLSNYEKNHQDRQILAAQGFIEKNFQHSTDMELLAQEVNMSKRNLIRRFKKATGTTPLQYLQSTRIEAAKDLIEKGEGNLTEIAFRVGYNDPKAFRKTFEKMVGLLPYRYKQYCQRSFTIS